MKSSIFLVFVFFSSLVASAQDPYIPTSHKDLVIKYTADWCIYCGGKGWDTMDTLWDESKSGSLKAVVVAVHSSSKLVGLNASGAVLGIEGNMVPSLSVMPSFSVSSKNLNNASTDEITAQVVTNNKKAPIANVGFFVKWASGNKSVTINTTTQFFVNDTGIYSVGVYAFEDGVMAPQAGRSSGPVAHKAVMRASSGTTAMGNQLLGISSVVAGQKVLGTYNMNIPTIWNKANLKFFAAVWKYKGYGLGWELVNVNDVATSPTIITDANKSDFKISVYPNPVKNQFSLSLPQNVSFCTVSLLDITGKVIAELYKDELKVNQSVISLNRPSHLSAGLYYLQVNTDDGSRTIQLVVE